MNKICPKCQQSFECNAQDIEHCQCSTIKLDTKKIASLQATYTDCLCISCLQLLHDSKPQNKD